MAMMENHPAFLLNGNVVYLTFQKPILPMMVVVVVMVLIIMLYSYIIMVLI